MGPRFFVVVGFVAIVSCFSAAQQPAAPSSSSDQCIDCHTKATPSAVLEWKQSKHSHKDVGCTACHGSDHTSASDVEKVKIPTPETCAPCHQAQVDQYNGGKHRHAMAAMRTMPTIHWQPMLAVGDFEGCVACHKIGSPEHAPELRLSDFGELEPIGRGSGACDSCHSRHTFSTEEAKQPEACQKCHSGLDHAQWEMYSSSKHGIRYDLKRRGSLPAEAAAPTCQTCHMANGDHGGRTSWGYFGISLPLPDDPQWAADRSDIMKALSAFGPEGNKTTVLGSMKGNESLRFSASEWQQERGKMIKICAQCHSEDYARKQLQMGDAMIQNADHLLADAIRVVAGLYRDKVLPNPWGRPPNFPFPWLISFKEPATVIEKKLQMMYLEHRTRAFQGAFHGSPDYAIWHGWSEMRRDLTEIKEMAAEIRRHPITAGAPPKTKGAQPPKAK
jgi:hypothetical protein